MLYLAIIVSFLVIICAEDRIIGGENAFLGEFPYQISLRFEGRHVCGGSIIHELCILTAAHCVYHAVPEKYTVVSGSVLLSEGGDTHHVASIKYHEKYDPNTLINDIAIIKLKDPIIFNENQKPVALTIQDTPGGLKGKFSGWGLHLYPGNSNPNNLQKMDVFTYNNDECQKLHNSANQKSKTIYPGMLCGFDQINVGACKGDSGGALILAEGKEYVQIGVISWVWKHCALGAPDVYTRVYSYLDWINENTDNLDI